jgi:hypothetical protein
VKAEVNRLYGIVHYSVGFDLDQPVRVDEASDLHDGIDGTNVTKEPAVDLGHRVPVIDVRHQDPGSYDMTE